MLVAPFERFQATSLAATDYGRSLVAINETSTGTATFLFLLFAQAALRKLAERQIYEAREFANGLFNGDALIRAVHFETSGDPARGLAMELMPHQPFGVFVNLRLIPRHFDGESLGFADALQPDVSSPVVVSRA
ncbi:MAG: hypothetical protein C5B57_07590 [Blastocatellia bacterium]|nr:MAG: hypothetical protein C5B57_07590 [Blastocatellia bacterium]